jgi:TonB-dependent SusC/RagA subfamily outer membrane receptor
MIWKVFAACCGLVSLAACARGVATRPGSATRPAPDRDTVQVGYGALPRTAGTGAIASLAGPQIDGQGALTVAELLERMPGVEVIRRPGGMSVRVRSAVGDALVVVDGTPLADAGTVLATLHAADVVRIDVLKDAGATASYGGRGGSGVVLITTRRAP